MECWISIQGLQPIELASIDRMERIKSGASIPNILFILSIFNEYERRAKLDLPDFVSSTESGSPVHLKSGFLLSQE